MTRLPEYLRNREYLARAFTHEQLLELAIRKGLPYSQAKISHDDLLDWLVADDTPPADSDPIVDHPARPAARRKRGG